MTQYLFRPQITEEDAWQIVQERVPELSKTTTELRHHPFSGFVYRLSCDVNDLSLGDEVHALVDRYTGKAYLTSVWPALEELQRTSDIGVVADPGWNSVTFEQAQHKAVQLMRTASLRRFRLLHRKIPEQQQAFELIWKPNWVLTGLFNGQKLQVLVDGLSGAYYVIGS